MIIQNGLLFLIPTTFLKEGTNEITAKLSCLSNSLSNNSLSNNSNATKWYSINVTGVTTPSNNMTTPTQSFPAINSSAQDEPNIDESQILEEEQEEPLIGAGNKNAEDAIKEEVKTLRERIMDEVEKGLKKEGIELNLPD